MNERVVTWLVTTVIVLLVFGQSYAKPEFAQQTGQPCNVCHPEGPPKLGPAGEYFKEHGTLEGYGGTEVKEKAEAGGRCNVCHANLEPNPTPRFLEAGPTSPNHRFELKHGGGRFWCFGCHDPVNRDKLRLLNGTQIDFKDAPVLCGQCHGLVYRDWKNHIHGRWAGSWENAEPALTCASVTAPEKGCHNPHDPKFKPIKPEPAPQKPPESPHFKNYNLYSAIVIAVAFALALFAAWK